MPRRRAVAWQRGLDDTVAAKVDRSGASDLAERHKVGLRLADALMTLPGSISAELREEARRHFTAEQVLELTLDVMKWNYQKVSVALGTDHEVRPGRLTELRFDADGPPT